MRSTIAIVLSLVLAALSAALTSSAPVPLPENIASTTPFLQATPTAQQEEISEIGSTDGIVIMGGVLALIILAPIFIKRKAWEQP